MSWLTRAEPHWPRRRRHAILRVMAIAPPGRADPSTDVGAQTDAPTDIDAVTDIDGEIDEPADIDAATDIDKARAAGPSRVPGPADVHRTDTPTPLTASRVRTGWHNVRDAYNDVFVADWSPRQWLRAR